MPTSIDVDGLTKRYGDLIAVDHISFTVAQGTVFAFLGTNGAGKSTTICSITDGLGGAAGVRAARGIAGSTGLGVGTDVVVVDIAAVGIGNGPPAGE